MEKIVEKIKTHKHEILLILLAIIYCAYFISATFAKYNNYYTGRFDLGNMSQTVWNTAHGNFFKLTDPNGTREISRLAFHADFILVLLAPFYVLWEDPRMLLLIQTIILSFGGIFAYLIAREVLKNKNLALTFAVCYFLNPAVNYTNLFDFHPVTLATTFLLGAFYFTLKSKYIWVVVFLVLAGLTKEEVWLINSLFGLYLIFFRKEKIIGALVTVVSGFLFYFFVWIAIPKALGGEHFALAYYSDYGGSPGQIIKNIIFSPIKTLSTLFSFDRLLYVRQLFLPLGYLPILAFPFLIFAAPDLGIDLLSSNTNLHQIYYQYSATVTPFIFIAAIYGVLFIKRKFSEIPTLAICVFLLLLTFLSAYNYGPLPFAKKPQNEMFVSPLENRQEVDNYINQISNNYSISATNNLGSHLSHRSNLYTIPQGLDKADIVMFLLRNSSDRENKTFVSMGNDPSYMLIKQDGAFYVFKKK